MVDARMHLPPELCEPPTLERLMGMKKDPTEALTSCIGPWVTHAGASHLCHADLLPR